ncbi:ATP:guanido phosphotransferase [Pontibacillus halophilus JSM 076056 = DSM 19796]|uniref:Protein-arginine kinase n=1 Tax=Pontibacillus halophilus JSM 076056 = DSM 19796 TaxID=1385510 RepID=A0A0A5I3L5_9BACI|nr:protein arginine kinase [Pontibacillus halophilus]KGX90417.1 ATP:guanido phosphotransferase [Pontibacillus halophilus JSM 076056 = DSM 19796]
MSLQQFMNEAISPWLKQEGPDNDIVLSTRIRLARNLDQVPFPIVSEEEDLEKVLEFFKEEYESESLNDYENLELVRMGVLDPVEKRVLVEKHLISPHLTERGQHSAALISQNEQVSIMINEEDHIRMQLYFPGFQLEKALQEAFIIDDWLEDKLDFAFDETRGYLTSCPTNVGTGMRASVMMHLPALVMTQQMNRIVPAINQLGLVVRGIYGEGSEAVGNIFQISNQITLGKSEKDIIEDLKSVVYQLIEQERHARNRLMTQIGMKLEDRIFRSYGVLANSRIIESKESANCLSDLRLGIDLGYITNVSKSILNELMIMTQPGFLQHYAKQSLSPDERDVRRASLIRERLNLEDE